MNREENVTKKKKKLRLNRGRGNDKNTLDNRSRPVQPAAKSMLWAHGTMSQRTRNAAMHIVPPHEADVSGGGGGGGDRLRPTRHDGGTGG